MGTLAFAQAPKLCRGRIPVAGAWRCRCRIEGHGAATLTPSRLLPAAESAVAHGHAFNVGVAQRLGRLLDDLELARKLLLALRAHRGRGELLDLLHTPR